jgi:hypothetical protein
MQIHFQSFFQLKKIIFAFLRLKVREGIGEFQLQIFLIYFSLNNFTERKHGRYLPTTFINSQCRLDKYLVSQAQLLPRGKMQIICLLIQTNGLVSCQEMQEIKAT